MPQLQQVGRKKKGQDSPSSALCATEALNGEEDCVGEGSLLYRVHRFQCSVLRAWELYKCSSISETGFMPFHLAFIQKAVK